MRLPKHGVSEPIKGQGVVFTLPPETLPNVQGAFEEAELFRLQQALGLFVSLTYKTASVQSQVLEDISMQTSDQIRAFIGDESGFQSLLRTRAARADGLSKVFVVRLGKCQPRGQRATHRLS
jgi:hypothetical protein